MSEDIIITTDDPNISFTKEEHDRICITIKKCIENMDELKRISDQQKEMRTRCKKLRNENKELFNDIIEFAADNGVDGLKLSNGYNIKINTTNKKIPINEDMINQGIIEQLKKVESNETIEHIGYDTFKDGIIECIKDIQNKTSKPNTTLKFIKPKKSSSKEKKSKK